MQDIWSSVSEWAERLSNRQAAMYGALATALLGGFGKYLIVPVTSWSIKKIGHILYPVASGSLFLDRVVALPRYLRCVREACGRLRNPWLEESQELSEIFVPVRATSASTGDQRVDLKQVFARSQLTVVVGDPGSGKTTGLRAIALDCVSGRIRTKENRSYVPVIIELRRLTASGLTLDEQVVQVFRDNGFPRPRRTIKRLKRQGRLAFMLDALDEVSEEHRQSLVIGLREFFSELSRSGNCQAILTSRPVGYSDQLKDLVDATYQMADFMPADMRQFIRNWQFRPPKSQQKLLKVLAERTRILEICRNPLMLTIVTSLYRETDYQLPDSREEFFRVCVDALLRRWDEARQLEERNKYAPGLKEAFLQDLSLRTLKDGFRPLSEASLLVDVELFMKSRDRKSRGAKRFLDEIVRSGLLGRLSTNEVYFAHKTFAESLASFYFQRSGVRELDELWEGSPEAWLEVCSLFVSDYRCSEQDIDLLLCSAHERGDWSGQLTIAGEAHVCPSAHRERILQQVRRDSSLWAGLDRRAIGSIARLGGAARETLAEMLSRGDGETRRLTIYALGLSREPWALQLVVDSMTNEETMAAAVEALGSLGDQSVPILEDLIRTRRGSAVLMHSCVSVLSSVGSPAAIAAALPLIWVDRMQCQREGRGRYCYGAQRLRACWQRRVGNAGILSTSAGSGKTSNSLGNPVA